MSTRRIARLLPSLLLAALAAAPPAVHAGALTSASTCVDSTTLRVTWDWWEDAANPVDHPEWIGYDLLRRTPADCGAWTRVNAQPFPRTPGVDQTFAFEEPASATHTLFDYRLVMVDASRQPVTLSRWECDGCAVHTYVACPAGSAPLVHGTVMDLGWAAMVMPCGATCYPTFYVEWPADTVLTPYAGTGTAVRLFGTPLCGTVEGCAARLDHIEVAPCGTVVPTARTSWGRVKVTYR